MPLRLETGQADFEARFEALLAAKREILEDVDQIVAAILADVRARGDAALVDLTARLDRLHLSPAELRIAPAELAAAEAVVRAVEDFLQRLPRAEIARASWEAHGAVILVDDLEAALALVDRVAPEHLELAVADPDALAARVRHAGAIFLGRYTPEAVGDYVAGPNHVLPTARSARFSSGLSVPDFMKRTSLIQCTADSLAAVGPAAVTLARAEGLDAHALSLMIRLDGGFDGGGAP